MRRSIIVVDMEDESSLTYRRALPRAMMFEMEFIVELGIPDERRIVYLSDGWMVERGMNIGPKGL